MSAKFLAEKTNCIHLEKRVIERISKGYPLDKRPDLVLWVCHFPIPTLSSIQCPVIIKHQRCPHGGPFSSN